MYYDDVTACIAVSCECMHCVPTIHFAVAVTNQTRTILVPSQHSHLHTHTLSRPIFYSLSMRVLIVTGVVNSPRPALVLPATVMLYTVNCIRSVSRSEVSLLGSSIVIASLPVCLLTV